MTLLTHRKPDSKSSAWWLTAIVSIICALPAQAQFSKDPVLNMTLRRQLGMRSVMDNAFEALNSAAEYARLRQAAADELASVRSRYWALYPDKPGFAEAEKEFSRLLVRREFYYLSQTINTGAPQRQMSALNVLTGGSRGYEIPFAAQKAFFNGWVGAVRAQLGGGQVVVGSADELRRAIEASQPQYEAYVILRDLEEFRLAGRSPPGVKPQFWAFASGFVDLLDQNSAPIESSLDQLPEYRGWASDRAVDPPYQTAETLYADTVRLFGAERVDAAYARVVAAQGPLAVSPELGQWRDSNRFSAMMNVLGSGSPKAFLLGVLRGGGRSTIGWAYAEEVYGNRVKAAGSEQALLSAAEKLRLAPKEAGTEQYNHPLIARPGDFDSNVKPVDGVLRDMLGIGEKAMAAAQTARTAKARSSYDFSGEYVVSGKYENRPFAGTMTFSPNADGTIGITMRMESLEWQQPRVIRQVARWHPDNEIRLDVDAAGPDSPAISYLVHYSGREIEGKWGTWEQDLGRVEIHRTADFRKKANIGGTYEMRGPRQGTVTVSDNGNDTYLFAFHEVHNAKIVVDYQGTARWLGPTLKVDFKDKHQKPRQYSVAGVTPGDALVEPYIPEQLSRPRGSRPAVAQPQAEPQAPAETPSRRRRQ